jgi:hypothetical protein
VSIAKVAKVFTLMNAYSPPPGVQIGAITFVGSMGAEVTYPLVAGKNIRDFYQGNFANTLNNGVPGVLALNAFECVDPDVSLGAGGTGNVNTGYQGTYVVDEQAFALPTAFLTQRLNKIIVTDTSSGSTPIILGVTTASE